MQTKLKNYLFLSRLLLRGIFYLFECGSQFLWELMLGDECIKI